MIATDTQQLRQLIARLERDRLRYEMAGDLESEAECFVDLVVARRRLATCSKAIAA